MTKETLFGSLTRYALTFKDAASVGITSNYTTNRPTKNGTSGSNPNEDIHIKLSGGGESTILSRCEVSIVSKDL